MAKKTAAKGATDAPPANTRDVEMHTMSIRFPKTMHERLRRLAFDTRRPMLEFIVEGIEEKLKAEKY